MIGGGVILDVIYLIERAWHDSLENDYDSAFGYEPYGFVETKQEAAMLVDNGGYVASRGEGQWRPKFRYHAISRLDVDGKP